MNIDKIVNGYLKESLNDSDVDAIIEMIKKDCFKYWKYVQSFKKNGSNFRIFRATKKHIYPYEKIMRRKDRRALDMPENIHKALDELFYKKFHWHVRSEGVFCQMNSDINLDVYGTTYYMFPIGDFDVVGNPNINDLFTFLLDEYIITHRGDTSKLTKEKYEYLEELVSNYISDVEKLYWSSSEVSINVNSYYLVSEPFVRENYFKFFEDTRK